MALAHIQAEHLDHKLVVKAAMGCNLVVVVAPLGYKLVEHLGHVGCNPFTAALVDLMELMDCTLEHYLLDLHLVVVALVVTNY